MLVKTRPKLFKAILDLKLKAKVRANEELANHTTLRIGGPAEIFIQPASLEDLRKIVTFVRENSIDLFILGGGSKVLLPDEGLKGIVLKLEAPFLKTINSYNGYVSLGSGIKINQFLNWLIKNSFSGLEFLAGIPGHLGGIVVLNAGIRDGPFSKDYISIGDFVEEVMVMDSRGEVLSLPKDALAFGYRQSNLSEYIVLEVKVSGLVKKKPEKIRKEIRRFLDYRKKTQELEFPSAGCVFKNPLGSSRSAGRLIELTGLKGKRMGDIAVSSKHANFMLNLGRGKSVDFLRLMDLIQRKVKLDHNVWLEPEIKIIKI